jgi:hypothetical protein
LKSISKAKERQANKISVFRQDASIFLGSLTNTVLIWAVIILLNYEWKVLPPPFVAGQTSNLVFSSDNFEYPLHSSSTAC